MNNYLNTSLNSVVSIDLYNSWAGRSLQEALRQAQTEARFQQRQMQEKEEKLLRLYETQQQRAFDKVSRSSSGGSSISGGTSPVGLNTTIGSTGAGRVRQMFDERRQKAGIDRSYPLEPLKQAGKLNGYANPNRVSSLDRSTTITKNPSNRQPLTMKSTTQRAYNEPSKPIKTRTVKPNFNSTYTSGRFVEENNIKYDRNDNDYAINSLKRQQRELERMINNHNLSDNLEDEEMPNVGIDEIDEGREDFVSSPNNYYVNERKRNINNGNHNNNYRISPTGSTPTKNINNNKSTPPTRKVATKTPTKSKTSNSTSKMSSSKAASQQVQNKGGSSTTKSSSNRVPLSQSAVANDNLVACKYCQRRFATDRLGKHEEICSRTLKKKRKTYDAVKHRVQGTEIEGYVKKGPKGTSVKIAKPPQMPKTDWRRQHEEFIATIRAAKMAQAHVAAGGKLSDLPPPPPSYNPDYVQCPHCGRRFNEAAAERHIPKCATMLHNKPNRLANGQSKKK